MHAHIHTHTCTYTQTCTDTHPSVICTFISDQIWSCSNQDWQIIWLIIFLFHVSFHILAPFKVNAVSYHLFVDSAHFYSFSLTIHSKNGNRIFLQSPSQTWTTWLQNMRWLSHVTRRLTSSRLECWCMPSSMVARRCTIVVENGTHLSKMQKRHDVFFYHILVNKERERGDFVMTNVCHCVHYLQLLLYI